MMGFLSFFLYGNIADDLFKESAEFLSFAKNRQQQRGKGNGNAKNRTSDEAFKGTFHPTASARQLLPPQAPSISHDPLVRCITDRPS